MLACWFVFICLSVYFSVCAFLCLLIHVLVWFCGCSFARLPAIVFVNAFACLFVGWLSVYLFVCLSVCLRVCSFVRPFVRSVACLIGCVGACVRVSLVLAYSLVIQPLGLVPWLSA